MSAGTNTRLQMGGLHPCRTTLIWNISSDGIFSSHRFMFCQPANYGSIRPVTHCAALRNTLGTASLLFYDDLIIEATNTIYFFRPFFNPRLACFSARHPTHNGHFFCSQNPGPSSTRRGQVHPWAGGNGVHAMLLELIVSISCVCFAS